MKLSIVLSVQPASFSALAYKGQMAENIKKIKDLGYDGVELAVRDPESLNLKELQSLLSVNDLPVPALGTGQAYGEEGLSFTNADVNIRTKAINRIKSQVHLADLLKTTVIIGLIRGTRTPETENQRAETWLIEALQECADENASVPLAIEPINRYETNLINTVGDGMRILEKVNMKNVGLLLDTFHMNIEEPSITESIIAAKKHLFHFHIADSNRWYPGAGHIDFKNVIDSLEKINYTGFVSAEILPYPDSDTAAVETIKNMRKIVGRR